MRTVVCVAVTCGAVLAIAGCGGDGKKPDMYPVTGTVTLDGKKIEKGSIVLDPKDGQGMPVAGGIENGEFSFEAPAGEKIVRISASEETSEKDQYGEPVSRSLIPEHFNRKSTLTETIREGENPLTFDLKSAKAKAK